MKTLICFISLLMVTPCIGNDLSEVLAIDAQIDADMAEPIQGDYLVTQTDSNGNTWMLVDRGDVQESKYLLAGALFALGIAGWLNQDMYGAVAGTAFFIGAASIKF